MKQKLFAWGDDFKIQDAQGQDMCCHDDRKKQQSEAIRILSRVFQRVLRCGGLVMELRARVARQPPQHELHVADLDHGGT